MTRVRYKTINEVHTKCPTNRYGFTDDEAKEFLSTRVIHDQRIPLPKFIHIYSKIYHAFQMDTFIDHPDYLMLINVNTRKAYAYEMHGKGAKEALRSLNAFIRSEPQCKAIKSDHDTAYLSNSVLDFMREHDIIHTTTFENDHNKLGIINTLA